MTEGQTYKIMRQESHLMLGNIQTHFATEPKYLTSWLTSFQEYRTEYRSLNLLLMALLTSPEISDESLMVILTESCIKDCLTSY